MNKFKISIITIILFIITSLSAFAFGESNNKTQQPNPNLEKITQYTKDKIIEDFNNKDENLTISLSLYKRKSISSIKIIENLKFENKEDYNKALDLLNKYRLTEMASKFTVNYKFSFDEPSRTIVMYDIIGEPLLKIKFNSYEVYLNTTTELNSILSENQQKVLYLTYGAGGVLTLLIGLVIILLIKLIK